MPIKKFIYLCSKVHTYHFDKFGQSAIELQVVQVVTLGSTCNNFGKYKW
jgi:hypothetical protein